MHFFNIEIIFMVLYLFYNKYSFLAWLQLVLIAVETQVPMDNLGQHEWFPPKIQEGMFIWVAADARTDEEVEQNQSQKLELWYAFPFILT